MTTTALATWVHVLDELEQRIAAQEHIVELAAQGRHPDPEELLELVGFTEPDGLPPIPEALGDRARQLLARSDAVRDNVAELVESTRPRRGTRPSRASRRPSATNLDVRA